VKTCSMFILITTRLKLTEQAFTVAHPSLSTSAPHKTLTSSTRNWKLPYFRNHFNCFPRRFGFTNCSTL